MEPIKDLQVAMKSCNHEEIIKIISLQPELLTVQLLDTLLRWGRDELSIAIVEIALNAGLTPSLVLDAAIAANAFCAVVHCLDFFTPTAAQVEALRTWWSPPIAERLDVLTTVSVLKRGRQEV